VHVKELNDWVLHTRETSELRLQTEQMGRSMADWLRNQYQGDEALMPAVRHLAALPPTYPVAFALAASATQASVREVLLAYAFRLGREHGAGRPQIHAAGPKRRPAHPGPAGRAIPAGRRPRRQPDGQRAPGVFAHAGHPERPARSAIFKTFSLLAQAGYKRKQLSI
jgi:hypothetical protein